MFLILTVLYCVSKEHIICALLILGKGVGRVVLYYTGDVKEKKLIKKKIIMRPSASPDYLSCHFNREVEEQFNNSGDFFYQAIENADGVPYQLVFGPGVGKGYYLNVGYGIKELLGISHAEFTEDFFLQMIEEIVPLGSEIPRDPFRLREKMLTREIKRYKAEIKVITTTGDTKWIKDCSMIVSDDKTGKVTGLMGIFFDITDKKQTLQLLDKALEKANESDRLKTAFLNNLSHEIRTPLNAIVGFSTLLVDPGQSPGSGREYMDIITHSSDHLLEIVDDVVEISKIEAKVVRIINKETNLNQMLERIYDRFRVMSAEKNVILNYSPRPDEKDTIITTDGYKLFQSINNLVSNAVKFTIEGKVEFGFSVKEGYVEFYVSDSGIGIRPEYQSSIFKPFYQAESSSTKRYEGTGLGLSIAKAYIELLGGEIWFNSEPGEGSVFCFRIPARQQGECFDES
jgi:signal transduction histidine kinase